MGLIPDSFMHFLQALLSEDMVLYENSLTGLKVLDIDPQVASDSTLSGLGRHISKIAFKKLCAIFQFFELLVHSSIYGI